MEIGDLSKAQLGNIGSIDQKGNENEKKQTKGKSFSQMLKQSIKQVNNLQHEADQASKDLALGKTNNIHEVMIAAQKAKTSLELTSEINSKAVSAYKEIMRMQV